MDILGQYEKQNPQQPQAPQHTYTNISRDSTPIISFVMRLSRGRIRDARQATIVLFAGATFLIGVSLYFFLSSGSSGHPIIKAPPPETVTKNLPQTVNKNLLLR